MRNTSASKLPARKLSARKLPARKLLGAVIAATLFIPTSGFTLGLGEIEVSSALNQKLSADIELLSTTAEDSENIIVKLASRKAFTRAGLDRPYSLNDLRFKAEIINGVPHIKVSSGSPIREPFLNFLVEVDWPNGHLLREYTVLLDPPVFMTQAASVPVQQASTDSRPTSGTIYSTPVAPTAAAPTYQFQAPAPVVQQPVNQPSVNQSRVKQPRVQAAPAVRQPVQQPVQRQVIQQQVEAVWNPPVASEYKIKRGDTAWSLADSMRPDQSVSVEQMMVAMLRHNPESFIDGNINGLRRGYVLRVPDYEQIASVNKNSARALVRKQAALWRQYQQTKSGGQLASAMEKSPDGSADSRAAKSLAAKKDDAHLAIVSAGSGASTASSKDPTEMTAKELRAELALARERIETERVEKEGLQKQVSQLEESTHKMKGMLSIEDDQLSNVQALNLPADAAKAKTKLDDTLAELKEATETAVEETTNDAQDAAKAVTDDVVAEAGEMIDSLTDTKSTENTDDALFVDETTQEGAENATATPVNANSTDDAVQPQPITSTQSWLDKTLDQLKSNPTLAAAAGGGLLLLLGLFGWMFKRGKPEADDVAVTSGFDGLEDLADEVAEEQEAELQGAVDEDASDSDVTASMDDSDETDEATVEDVVDKDEDDEEEAPRDDVIAEADVYLAYGIYQQAEELLTQAIEENPDRNDYRLKLAETHYASKNADAYVETATEIKDKVEEDSTIWKKVLVMGQDLCSDNVMFQGSLIGGLDLDSITPQAPEMDLDLGLDAANSDEMESMEDNTELELPEVESLAGLDDEVVDEIDEAEELEFDLSDADATEQSESVDEDEFSLDIDASELDIASEVEGSETGVDFGLDEVAEEVSEIVDDVEEEVSLDLTAEADALNIVPDANIEAALDDNAKEVDDEVSLDLTDVADTFNLDLDDDANDSIEIISDNEADDDDFDLSSLDDVDEISTKLDLARAYLDMGDKEGTRSILEEVVAEGNDDQKHEASSLMAKLG